MSIGIGVVKNKLFTPYHPRQEGGLVLSWESRDINNGGAWPASGAKFSSLTDNSGAKLVATQATGANQETFSTAGLNGNPKIVCNSSGYMTPPTFTLGANNTFFLVCTPGVSGNNYIINFGSSAEFISNFSNGTITPKYEFLNGSDRQNFNGTAPTGVNIVELTQVDGVSCVGKLNGTQYFSITPTAAFSGQTLTQLFAQSSNSFQYTGDFYAFMVFNWALSAAAEQRVWRYFGYQLGIGVV